MTRTALDSALVLGVIAGHDDGDPTSLKAPPSDYLGGIEGEGLKGLRLGVPSDWFFDVCDPQIADAARSAILILEESGAEIVNVHLPHVHLCEIIFWTIQFSECSSLHERTLDLLPEVDTSFAEQLVRSTFVSGMDYLHALRARHVLQLDFEAAFEQVDAIVSPGCPIVAPPMLTMIAELGEARVPWLEVAARCTAPYNVTGLPALTIPSGLNSRGLPMSISVAARPLAEATCLRIGHAFQQLTSHHKLVPSLLGEAPSLDR